MFKFRVWNRKLNRYATDLEDFYLSESGDLMILRYQAAGPYLDDAIDEYNVEYAPGIKCCKTGVDLFVGDIVIFRDLKGAIIFDDHFMSFMLEDCEGQYHRICKINQYEKIGGKNEL
jgi:hypothetical protein